MSSSSLAVVLQVSLLGDTSEWDRAHPHTQDDIDLDDSCDPRDVADALAAQAAGVKVKMQQQAAASFVKESGELELLLLQLPYESTAAQRMADILDEYQEQCELLDPHLPHAITTLMNYVHAMIRPGKASPVPPANSTTGAIKLTADTNNKPAEYTPNKPRCSDQELLTRVFKVIYTLAKVRGYKTIVHFFPHEVADLEPTLSLLQQQSMDDFDTWETRYGLLLWLSIIVLIPFDLSTVDSSMTQQAAGAPAAAAAASTEESKQPPPRTVGIISSLIFLGERYMSDTGPPREAAAVMLAKLFSRADMHASHLAAFFRWCTDEIARVGQEQTSSMASSKNVFLVTGIFRSLCQIFRHAPRDVLLVHVGLIHVPILQQAEVWEKSTNSLVRKLFIKLAQRVGLTYLPVRVAKWRYQRGHRSLLTTLQQATGVAVSPPAAANPMLGSSHAVAASASAVPSSGAGVAASDDDEDEDVPSEIEDIIQVLLDGLRDRDTIVRWSAAKGVGRLTNCLPASFGDDVVGSVLELFSGRESDGAWHGGCLALAELARRGLLLPERLAQVVPITLKALTYDQRTATHSIGAHVRDASCYVQWAFARAYAPEVMTPYMQSLAAGLLTICVFDREVNVRRAASAAFQEHVGRQGSSSFAHGMEILQVADYFTVSNRANAYTQVAIEVAKYEAYTRPLIDHLLTWKVKHWEKEMRELTAKTLGLLAKRNRASQTFMQTVVVESLLTLAIQSNDLAEKHGCVLSAGEILLALHQLDPSDFVSTPLRLQTCAVITTLTSPANSQLLNGRGGQIMREAVCRLIEVTAHTGLLYTNSTTLAYLRPYQAILDENLAHTNAEVQAAAIRGVEQFVRGYYLPSTADDAKATADKLARAKAVLDHYTRTLGHPSSLAGATRGFAAALGTIPRELLCTSSVNAREVYAARVNTPAPSTTIATPPSASSVAAAAAAPIAAAAAVPALPPSTGLIYQPLSRILQTLIVASTECAQADAETRRNSIQALVKLVETLAEDDLLQYMTPMPNPPQMTPPPAIAAAAPAGATPAASSSASSAATSAAREKELKAAHKLAKVHYDMVQKYWTRDLGQLGLPGDRICDRVATAFLIALDDYATDNRGDVGSWVREAAMIGLNVLCRKLARIQANRPSDAVYPPLLSTRVFPALLKQAVEKIDRVREHAGILFHGLLWCGQRGGAGAGAHEAEIPAVPLKEDLRKMFPLVSIGPDGKEKVFDWSAPGQTFPAILPVMALPASSSSSSSSSSSVSVDVLGPFPYHRSILSGLVLSVGGLTESVVKSSSDAFLAYVSALSSSISSGDAAAGDSLELLKQLAGDLLVVLQQEKGHARVIVPAFKTLELLLSQNLLEALTLEVCAFAADLQARVWKEVSKSTNIHKLMASISVLVGLLAYPTPLRTTVFLHLLHLLGHATFPKIRRLTGESLYNALLIDGDQFVPGADEEDHAEKVQAILDILTATPWDGPVGPARTERDKLYALLGLEKPKLKAKVAGAPGSKPSQGTDGDISALGTDYSSLVRTIGY